MLSSSSSSTKRNNEPTNETRPKYCDEASKYTWVMSFLNVVCRHFLYRISINMLWWYKFDEINNLHLESRQFFYHFFHICVCLCHQAVCQKEVIYNNRQAKGKGRLKIWIVCGYAKKKSKKKRIIQSSSKSKRIHVVHTHTHTHLYTWKAYLGIICQMLEHNIYYFKKHRCVVVIIDFALLFFLLACLTDCVCYCCCLLLLCVFLI